LIAAVDFISHLLPGTPGLHCSGPDTAGSYGVPGVVFTVAPGNFRFVPKCKLKTVNDFKVPGNIQMKEIQSQRYIVLLFWTKS
jgi:hypothetical protein